MEPTTCPLCGKEIDAWQVVCDKCLEKIHRSRELYRRAEIMNQKPMVWTKQYDPDDLPPFF